MDTSSLRWAHDRVFNSAWAYDLAFAWDVGPELDVATALAAVSPLSGQPLLVPACGTGRHVIRLAERGFRVDASDINPEMLALARRERAHPHVTYSIADMTLRLGEGEGDCQGAFTFCNSFRYILEEQAVAGHLEAVRRRLRPGGVYVIELALNPQGTGTGGRQRWAAVYEDRRVVATWTILQITPPTSLEQAEIRVEEPNGVVHAFAEEQPQRLWTFDQLVGAAGRAGFALDQVAELDGTPAPDPGRPGRYYVALRRRG